MIGFEDLKSYEEIQEMKERKRRARDVRELMNIGHSQIEASEIVDRTLALNDFDQIDEVKKRTHNEMTAIEEYNENC